MSETILTPGADVITPRGRGVVVDVRATPSGRLLIGVEDVTGEVGYFTQKVVRLPPG
jgi:DNA polymerase II small subunit/DNA polymerase delta subunit B